MFELKFAFPEQKSVSSQVVGAWYMDSGIHFHWLKNQTQFNPFVDG